jgi:hypothetical protein
LIYTTDLFSTQASHIRPMARWRYHVWAFFNSRFKVAYVRFQLTHLSFAVFVRSREIVETYGVVICAHLCEFVLENFDSCGYTVVMPDDKQITRDDGSIRHDLRPFISIENQILTCSRCTVRINFNVTNP